MLELLLRVATKMPKKITIANSQIVDNSQTEIADAFYKRLGSWVNDGQTLAYQRAGFIPFRIFVDSVAISGTLKTNSILEAGYEINLIVDPSGYDPSIAASFIGDIQADVRYSDYSAQIVIPDSFEDVLTDSANLTEPSKPNVTVDYNYLRDNIPYERAISDVVNEKSLVNYYEPRMAGVSGRNSYVKLANNAKNQSESQRNRFTKMFVPPENVTNLVNANTQLDETSIYSYEVEDLDYTSEIPFLTKIKLKDTNGDIDQKLNFVKLGNNFLFYATQQENDPEGDIGSLLMRWHLEDAQSFIGDGTYVYSDPTTENSELTLKTFSFLEWLNDFAPARVGAFPNDLTPIKFANVAAPSLDFAQNNYEDVVNYTKTLSRLAYRYTDEVLGSNSTKRIEDVFAGIPGNTEILYYKIDKFQGATVTGTPIQTILIPNNREDIQFLDTQVFYDQQYTYRLSYMVAIHGCEYEYKSVDERDDGTYLLKVNSYPCMKVVELPVFTKLSSVLSSPPLAPRVEIYPIRRQENKVKIVFYSGYGSELSKPFSLTNSDNQNNNRILTSNYLGTENGLIEHNSITSVSNFEIYSAAREPDESGDYTYFTDRLLTSISTRATRGSGVDAGLLADSAATVLNLRTNKTYYFTFLARNRLGLSSQPTSIFKIKYINKDGISRLEYEEFINEGFPKTRRETKTLTKFVNIRPVFQQVAVNPVKSELITPDSEPLDSQNKPIYLGNTGDDMFGPPGEGKKFKFRFRSRKTNKVFDINLTCVNTRVYTDFDVSGNSDSDSFSPAFGQTLDSIDDSRPGTSNNTPLNTGGVDTSLPNPFPNLGD